MLFRITSDQKLAPGQTNLYALFVPFDGFQFVIQVVSNRFSPGLFRRC
jgi:hypothetical protein